MRYIFFLLLFLQSILLGESYDPNAPKEYGVLGLTGAIIDHYFFITNEELKAMAEEKGSWAPIDYPTLCSLLNKNKGAAQMAPGGSGSNVIKGLAQLGQKCAIVGKVGNDDKGKYYSKKMKELGVVPLLEEGALPTGQAVCLITPDRERTFRTYLGASHSLTDLKFDPSIFEKVDLFHLEGYQLVDPDLVIRTLKLAKEANVLISVDLASLEVVRRNKTFIRNILEKYIDIVFCNEVEAEELTGLKPKEASRFLSELCAVSVVTMSDRGSWVSGKEKQFRMGVFPVQVIDTTGAGDLYASGFLHGYLTGKPLEKCAQMGTICASYVIKRVGAEIPDQVWTEIKGLFEENPTSQVVFFPEKETSPSPKS
ncbi:adenosine kinase [Candidatus Neptunochlamydia vexilliferae]|uniref:Carbohydrate kinase PfkB domain-containing protein n=1 Tax=Candidatus Neptunichlamydia vexilliferae TaxID=1651774 RepID=A0ABS0AZH7_9BACT|nr:adenosine kinase [Candidatus Neptunochlamydia vexilliferae]MBF5059537.1 hypothetical protein [Candidatus Neptunochlamydia vexilliferae]